MIDPEERKLFTVKDVSRACGVSRATLIRMEEGGFLTPFRTDPDSGYRYYDMQNVAAIGQYQRLQSIGLSRSEIADVYFERVDSAEFIAEQRRKLESMRRFLNEYEMSHDQTRDRMLSYTILPPATYYCADISASSAEEVATLAYVVHERCMSEGYRLLGSEPAAAVAEDWRAWLQPPSPNHNMTLCFPVVPEPDSDEDPNLRFFPETEALTIIGFGNYSVIPELWRQLYEELAEAGLEPTGLARLIALVAPYVGTHIRPDEFCYECIIPIDPDCNSRNGCDSSPRVH